MKMGPEHPTYTHTPHTGFGSILLCVISKIGSLKGIDMTGDTLTSISLSTKKPLDVVRGCLQTQDADKDTHTHTKKPTHTNTHTNTHTQKKTTHTEFHWGESATYQSSSGTNKKRAMGKYITQTKHLPDLEHCTWRAADCKPHTDALQRVVCAHLEPTPPLTE